MLAAARGFMQVNHTLVFKGSSVDMGRMTVGVAQGNPLSALFLSSLFFLLSYVFSHSCLSSLFSLLSSLVSLLSSKNKKNDNNEREHENEKRRGARKKTRDNNSCLGTPRRALRALWEALGTPFASFWEPSSALGSSWAPFCFFLGALERPGNSLLELRGSLLEL